MWSKGSIQKIIENFAMATGHKLTPYTTLLDTKYMPTLNNDLALWMDTINSHPGGWFHRVKHGHDYFANFQEIHKTFGLKGSAQYPYELLKDSTTSAGIPMPGTQFLVNKGLIGAKKATQWLSLNMMDVFSGGIAIHSTYKLYKKKDNGVIDKKDIVWASVGVGVKIISGVVTTNPILILSGVTDSAILITNLDEAKAAFEGFFNWDLTKKTVKSLVIGSLIGSGAIASTTSLIGIFGTASTGTAISTLSGAALTNATLAAIGGGSIASAGLGVLGGTLILGSSGIAVGLGASLIAYKCLNKTKAA